jgi:sec-independent protein translocase protein TatC
MSGPLYVLYAICVVLAYFIDKKDREAYPEYHAELAKDEAELEKEMDDWDKDGYTPWFSDDKDDDMEDEYQQRVKAVLNPTPAPTAETPSAEPGTPESDPKSEPQPETEPTLEELARRDELSKGADPSRNQD